MKKILILMIIFITVIIYSQNLSALTDIQGYKALKGYNDLGHSSKIGLSTKNHGIQKFRLTNNSYVIMLNNYINKHKAMFYLETKNKRLLEKNGYTSITIEEYSNESVNQLKSLTYTAVKNSKIEITTPPNERGFRVMSKKETQAGSIIQEDRYYFLNLGKKEGTILFLFTYQYPDDLSGENRDKMKKLGCIPDNQTEAEVIKSITLKKGSSGSGVNLDRLKGVQPLNFGY